MTRTPYAKVLRASLGLAENATDAEVAAACAARPAGEVCDAVGCHCALSLAEGTPGLTPDQPLAVIVAPEVAAGQDNPAVPTAGNRCCKTDVLGATAHDICCGGKK